MRKTNGVRNFRGFAELILLGLITSFFCFGCSSTKETTEEHMLRGWVGRPEFVDPQYPQFSARYDTVQVAQDVVDLIRELNDGVEWIVVFGTWCSDSWREVPTFLKIADSAGIDVHRVRFYAVDRSKHSEDGVTDQYAITMVPVFIFLKAGEEIGRIVEKPEGSMEGAILSILADSVDR